MTLALTVGPATDKLYALAQTAVTGVTVGNFAAVACDGPAFTLENAMFIVGLDAPVDEAGRTTSGNGAAIILGGASLQETYDVPCCVDVRLAGATQKQVRDLAVGMFDTFLNGLMADRSLGGVLAGGGAEIVNVAVSPFLVGSPSEPGQRCLISFAVRCTDLQIG